VDYHAKITPYGGVATRFVLGLLPATAPYQEIDIPYGAIILNEKATITFQGTAQTTGGVGSIIATLTRMANP
jgi:hypothetical protein